MADNHDQQNQRQAVLTIKDRMKTRIGIDLDQYVSSVVGWPWLNGFHFKCKDRCALIALYFECKRKMGQVWFVEDVLEDIETKVKHKQSVTILDSAFRENSPGDSLHIHLYFQRKDWDGGIHLDSVSIMKGVDDEGGANYAVKPWLRHMWSDFLGRGKK
jgi:hypothetical protein